MATDSFADAVASFRYLRNNAMTPVHIRKKDITARIISKNLLKCEHHEDGPVMPAQQRPPISHQKRRGASMIQFVCDSCGRVKEPSETWIVGTAAEAVGVTAARREVTIQSAWDRAIAVHPFAVHFCSIKCKDSYMAQLFAPGSPAEKVLAGPAEIVVERSGPAIERIITKVKGRSPRRKKGAA